MTRVQLCKQISAILIQIQLSRSEQQISPKKGEQKHCKNRKVCDSIQHIVCRINMMAVIHPANKNRHKSSKIMIIKLSNPRNNKHNSTENCIIKKEKKIPHESRFGGNNGRKKGFIVVKLKGPFLIWGQLWSINLDIENQLFA